MATHNASDGQVRSFYRPVFFQGFNSVLAAGGSEAAGWRCERGNALLIESDGENEQCNGPFIQFVQEL